jgi:predicted negative regulator of RcsB-dependent stress response
MTPGILGGLFSRGPSEETVAALESELDAHIGADEQTQYRLPGNGTFVHEQDGEREEQGGDGSLAVVTDHRVLFVAVGGETSVVDLPHTDIRSAELDSGLLKTVLVVEGWEGDSYRFRTAGGDTEAAVEYVERASDCWQFVETLTEELETYAGTIREAIEQREFDRVTEVLEKAEETTDELDGRVQAAGLENALGDRVEAARHNLQRTRIRTRQELARSQVDDAEARHLDGDRNIDYTGAYERYKRAYEHLSTARAIAREHDLDAAAVGRALGEVRERVELLTRQPVGLAKQATERALGTDDPAVRVETMRAALEHYHDALTVGWGTGLDRPYDRQELRFRVALLADGLVDAHQEYATRLEAAGDALAEDGDEESARERYRTAIEQLDAATSCAREFRVPDPGPVERERSRLAEKLDDG